MEDLFGTSEGPNFELVPEGKHLGIIRFAIDCGHIRDSYKGIPTVKHQIFIGWELDCKDSQGNPHWKGDFYTATDFINKKTKKADWLFGETSNFNKILRAWTGQDSSTVMWRDFLGKLIKGQHPCWVTIEHNLSKDGLKTYSNIDSIKPCKNGETFEPQLPILAGKPTEDEVMDLPGNIKKKIMASIEHTEGSYTIPPKSNKPRPVATEDDDIDF